MTAHSAEIVVAVADAVNDVATQQLVLEVVSTELRIVTDRLPSGVVTHSYSASIVAEGGSPPYRWGSSIIPPGLMLSGDGLVAELHGRPTRVGRFTVQVDIIDGVGATAPATFSVEVEDEVPLEILTTSLPSATPSVPYRAQIEATGELGPYRWQIRGGTLPAGLRLVPSDTSVVEIRGVAEALGSSAFEVEVEDRLGRTAQRAFTVEVTDELVITTASIEPGSECTELDAVIRAEGGSGSGYTWSVVQGSLPDGVQIVGRRTPSTLVFGTPRAVGRFPITIRVVDDQGSEATRAFEILVGPSTSPRFGLLSARDGNGNGVVYALDACAPVPTLIGPLSPPPPPGGFVGTADGLAIVGDKAVYGFEHGDSYDVYVVDLRGPVPTQVSVASALATPTFSPDSRLLALAGELEGGGRRAIYVVDVSDPAAPSPPRRVSPLGPPGSRSGGVAWSPDSTKVAFNGDLTTLGFPELFVVDVTTAAASPVVVSGAEGGGPPVWTTDSAHVVYKPDDNRLYVAGVGVPSRPLSTVSAAYRLPYLSPDRRWVTYAGSVAGQAEGQFVLDLANVDVPPRAIEVEDTARWFGFDTKSRFITATVWGDQEYRVHFARLASPAPAFAFSNVLVGRSSHTTFAQTVDAVVYTNDQGGHWVDLSGPIPAPPIPMNGMPSGALHAARDSDRVFVISDGIYLADLSDPNAPAVPLTSEAVGIRTVAPTARGLTLFYGQGSPQVPRAIAAVGPDAGQPITLGPPGTTVRRFLLP